MKVKVLMTAMLSAVICASCCRNDCQQKEDSNFLLNATAWYQQSAEMRACYYQSYRMARMALNENLKNYNGDKPTAVVLDIDETVLDNSPFEAKLIADGKAYSDSAWNAWSMRGEARALPGAPEFINFAKQNGVEVFFISNRKENEFATTLKNLEQAGMPTDSANLLIRRQGTGSCKDERRDFVASNYEIILYIGDNLGDYTSLFDGRDEGLALSMADSMQADFGTKFIILPNPMYGEWENAIYNYNFGASINEKNQMMLDLLDK